MRRPVGVNESRVCMLQIRRSAECLHLGALRGPLAGGERLRSRSESPRRPTEPAAIPALDRVSGEDARVAPSKCYRRTVWDKDARPLLTRSLNYKAIVANLCQAGRR